MSQLLIRNVPDEMIEAYKSKTRLSGRSLEQEFRELLESHMPLSPSERVAVSLKYMAQFAEPLRAMTRDEIRDGLE